MTGKRRDFASRIEHILLLGAAFAAAAAISLIVPASAAPSCTPTGEGQNGGASRTNAKGVQYCTGGTAGIAYKATGGDLTVNLDKDPITGHAININDDGLGRNITVYNGLTSSGYVAAPIFANDSGSYAVNLKSTGGNVVFQSLAGGTVTYSGAGVGAAIAGQTTGNGSVALTTYDNVTDTTGTGIGALAVNGPVSISAYGNVSAGLDALYAGTGGTGSVTVVAGTAANPVTVATSAPDVHDAVNAFSTGGTIGITTFGTMTGELLGQTQNGASVTISATGSVTATGTNAAIFAASDTGNVTVTTDGTVSNGIVAMTGGNGTLNVTTTGDVLGTLPYDTVYVQGVNGAVNLNASAGTITGGQGSHAIDAETSGTGAVTLTLGDGVTIDTPTTGARAYSAGGISTLTTGANEAITALDTDSAGGLTARSDAAPATAAITAFLATGANNTITVTGDDSAGLTAVNEGDTVGGVSLVTGSNNTVTVTGNTTGGLVAATAQTFGTTGAFDGAGNVSISVGAGNTITVLPGTDAGGLSSASGGVIGYSDGGNVDIEWSGAGGAVAVTGQSGIATIGVLGIAGPGSGAQTLTIITGSGTTIASGNGTGIVALNANFGLTNVVSNGAITATAVPGNTLVQSFIAGQSPSNATSTLGAGIIALGVGPVSVTSNAAVSMTGGDGIDAVGGTALNVNNNAPITASQSAIVGVSEGSLAITNGSTITGIGSANYPVVNFVNTSGTATFTNAADGVLRSTAGLPSDVAIGFASLNNSPSVGAASVVNNGAITGVVNFANASAATVTNNGTWTTSGTSTFSPGANVVNNAGTLLASGTTTFAALQTFTNTGLLDMHGANAAAGDLTVVSGAFIGGSGSKLALDTALSTAASGASCGAVSDCLQVASSSGITSIVVHDTLAANASGLNKDGILLVNGASAAGNFVLDPSSSGYDAKTGGLDEGLFGYNLSYANDQVRLVSSPNVVALQLPALVTISQTIWHETSPWIDRQADLRDQAGADGTGAVMPGLWGKALGSLVQRADTTSGVDTGYHQKSYGFVAGGDTGAQHLWSPGDTLLGGVMLGYVGSNADFDTGSLRADYSGLLVGAYGTYLNDGWVVDLAAKGDFFTLNYRENGQSLFASKPKVRNIGGEFDAGKRMALQGSVFVEPVAGFSYLSNAIDNAIVRGTTVHFGDNESARGNIGLRVGVADIENPDAILNFSLTGRVIDEFAGNNKATIVMATPLTLSDKFSGVFGEALGSIEVFGTHNGLSGFVNADVKFRANFTSETLTAGVRYHW